MEAKPRQLRARKAKEVEVDEAVDDEEDSDEETITVNPFATTSMRDDVEKVLFPLITDRCQEFIRTTFGGRKYFALGEHATEEEKAAFKERPKTFAKFKNDVVGGLMNAIVKFYFSRYLVDPLLKQEFFESGTRTDGKAARITKLKFRKYIERWWLVVRTDLIKEILDQHCRNPDNAQIFLIQACRNCGEEGWNTLTFHNNLRTAGAAALMTAAPPFAPQPAAAPPFAAQPAAPAFPPVFDPQQQAPTF